MRARVATARARVTVPRRAVVVAVVLIAGLGLALISLVVSPRPVDWLTPGMLGLLLTWTNLSIGALPLRRRLRNSMQRLAATAPRPGRVLSTPMLTRLLAWVLLALALSLAQGAVLLAVALLVFRMRVVGSWGVLLAVVTLGTLTMLAVGLAMGSFAKTTKTAKAARVATVLVGVAMLVLGGSYVPTESVPTFLRPVMRAMPLSYLNDALRQVINTGANFAGIATDLMVLAAWLVAALVLSTRAIRWSYS